MKLVFALLFILILFTGYSQEVKGIDTLQPVINSSKTFVQFTGIAAVSRIGFSPVPSFSFDKPIASVFLSIIKNRLSYEPGFFVGLNGRPWIIENWVKYRIIDRGLKKISAGINPSLFFKNETSYPEKEIIKANRNLTFGLFGDFTISKKSSVKLIYWYNQRFDSGTISGHFIDMTGSVSNIVLSKKLFISLKPELFYFNNTGKVDGLFASGYISLGHKQYPLSLYLQGVQPIWANFPDAAFKWNSGLIYPF